MAVVLRNGIKRSLLRLGLAPSEMTNPPPKKSPPEHFDRLVEQLGGVAERGSSRLSDEIDFRSAIDRLQERLFTLRREFLI